MSPVLFAANLSLPAIPVNMLASATKPFILTIFGASGDLAKIKIFPSLYELAKQQKLPKHFLIVGFARTTMTRAAFQKEMRASIKKHAKGKVDTRVVNSLLEHVHYFSGQYNSKDDFESYTAFLKSLCKTCGMRKANAPHIAYFSVPPIAFKDIVKNLAETRSSKRADIRLVIEKPFGEDKKSAEKLFHFVSEHFDEKQVYLLDHYLGKSSVQSILNMRHSNRILSNILHGSEVANIQISAFENVGVEHRIGYFEQVGIVRDVIQSHLLQVLALVTMHIPNTHKAKSLQREKNNMLEAIDCACDSSDVVIGQYRSYRSLRGVKKTSRTETFAAVRLFLDHQEWYKVPIYLRTGKKLNEKHTYAVIELKKFPFQDKDEEPNRVIIQFYPEPRISIQLVNYQEGADRFQEVSTSASIACSIEGCLPEHADLLLDVMSKDRIHFLSFAEIIAAWAVVDHITMHMAERSIKLHTYNDGSRGPVQQDKLTEKDGFHWFDPHA